MAVPSPSGAKRQLPTEWVTISPSTYVQSRVWAAGSQTRSSTYRTGSTICRRNSTRIVPPARGASPPLSTRVAFISGNRRG